MNIAEKGHRIGIEGRLQISQYEKDGVKKSGYSVIVDTMEFLQSKNEGTQIPQEKADNSQSVNDDEFPF